MYPISCLSAAAVVVTNLFPFLFLSLIIKSKKTIKRVSNMGIYTQDTGYEIDRLCEFADNWKNIIECFPDATHFRFKVTTSGINLIVLLKDSEKNSWAYILRDFKGFR
jgi:hypothetical protein